MTEEYAEVQDVDLRSGGQLGDRDADDAIHEADAQLRQCTGHYSVSIRALIRWAAAAAAPGACRESQPVRMYLVHAWDECICSSSCSCGL